MAGLTIADRIKSVLAEKKATITSIARTDTERVNITRQLNGQVKVSMETVNRILECFPEISAEYIMRGEGTYERTKIVVPPQHRQDIHLAEGARAAISQSGTATIDADEPLGHESLSALLEEKDKIIAELQHDKEILKEAIRVLSAK